MFSAERLSEQDIFSGTVAGILGEIPGLFTRQYDRVNQMLAIKLAEISTGIAADDNLIRKSDLGASATVSSIALFDGFSNFGGLELAGDDPKFDRSWKSQPTLPGQVERDELTGMDFAVGDVGNEQVRSQSRTSSLFPAENWTFDFKDYTIDHQGLNTLNIKVGYELKPGITKAEYPDFVPIYKSIDNFLVNYPNETDFWEILNKNLTQKVLDENPVLTDVAIQLEVLPTNRLPYDRASTVSRSRSGKSQEDWNFSFKDYAINHQGLNKLNLDVNYQYKPGITKDEYPSLLIPGLYW
jgi:hypothetical protein